MRSTLSAWIPRGSDVAIIDVPVHRNAGDLFILAATIRFLGDLECRIVYRAGIRDYRTNRARRSIGRNTVLVGLGGGNFGDVYPRYQGLRERIVADFPANRIVILPQTVHFADPRARQLAAHRLGRHTDLRIAVRDRASLEAVRDFTPHVELLPDVVHALGASHHAPGDLTSASRRAVASTRDSTVFLMRRDKEGSRALPAGHPTVDWPDIFPELFGRLVLATLLMPAAPGPLAMRLHEWWSAYARDLLSRAIAWMSGADHVVTDRLHAAIVARLAGRPVTLCDNGYGKLAAYYDAWWRDDPGVELQHP